MLPEIGVFFGRDGVSRMAARNRQGQVALLFCQDGSRGQWCDVIRGTFTPRPVERESCMASDVRCPRCDCYFIAGERSPAWHETSRSCPTCGTVPLVGGWWREEPAIRAVMPFCAGPVPVAICVDGDTFDLAETPLFVLVDRLADAGVIEPVDGESREMPTLGELVTYRGDLPRSTAASVEWITECVATH